MFQALQQRLKGQPSAVPLLVQQRRPCCQRSVNLLACFDVLASAARSLTSTSCQDAAQAQQVLEATSERIVSMLAQQRWTQAELESLPFGVALPLRQVRGRARFGTRPTTPHAPRANRICG